MSDVTGWSGVVLVTGTGTGIGKTVVTAALAGSALAAARRVVVVKPVQTGVGPDEPGDAAEVERLLGPLARSGGSSPSLVVHEFLRLPEPLAPQAAAARAGVVLPPVAAHAARIAELAAGADLVLVEGAGGALVRLDDGDGIVSDLGPPGRTTGAVVVTEPGLGTLNVTELTVEALSRRGVLVLGLVIGCWPAEPGVVERSNLVDLPRLTGVPLLGVVRQGPERPPRLTSVTGSDPTPPD